MKETLTDDDVLECKKAIFHVVGMESRNEPLPVVNTGLRGKGTKRYVYPNMLLVWRVGMNHSLFSILDYE